MKNDKNDEYVVSSSVPRTKLEKQAEINSKYGAGHVVNPVKTTGKKLRRMDWKKAKDIAPEGTVTTAQLWRHLCMRYQEAFGDEVLENQLPDDRHAIQAWFDRIRQIFIERCGYNPNYRDIAQYFSWFLAPERLKRFLRLDTLQGKQTLRPQQLEGNVYIRKFYDEEIRSRSSPGARNPFLENDDKQIEFIRQAFARIAERDLDSMGLVYSMARFGVVMVAQYLHERKGLGEAACRKNIVQAMREYVASDYDQEDAEGTIRRAIQISSEYEELYNEATMWRDWRRCTDGMVDEVLQKCPKNIIPA